MSSKSDSADKERECKRRKKNLESWKRNKTKDDRTHGKRYLNTRGNVVEPKTITDFNDNCCETFSIEERRVILSQLLNMNSKNEQDIYLMGLMEIVPIKRRRTTINAQVKKVTFHYYVLKESKRMRVCKKVFLYLH
ncbi:hypothetical protein RN001_005408 [Aquatica leii]|uniref:Uncharacterized protein n=1 Tax=Aquatica leii TaxID=1421715 RepID=A0AAN7SIV6_9COLE|nr:hypothetical protein RN001_005408 [Aquatica leii]